MEFDAIIYVDAFATVTLTFDLQNLIRSSAWASSVWACKYSLLVSSRLLKQFMRYHGNKICADKWMVECGRQRAQKHNALADAAQWQKHKIILK